jgi:hypothetical protein
MPRHAARALIQLLRQSAMALLMLAALVNPVLVTVSDLHDVGRGSDHSHNAGEHGADLAGPDFAGHMLSEHGLDREEGDETDDFLHALMHASHCCGHLTAIYHGSHAPDVVPARSDSLPAQVEQRLPQASSDPFRPPITV